MMRVLSVCSGIGCADLAFSRLGWECAAMSEIEPFPRAVLAHRFPGVPVHGDFTTIKGDEYGPVNLIVGGTPCQSFSIAGLRGGMADERGNLALEYLRLVDRVRPAWCVWENVPGVLSSNGGRDFGAFLGGLVELGYGLAYRVLDAQHFGLAQRRERVFVVGCAGDWRRAAAVLFEPASLRGHPAPRREAGEGVAAGTLRSTDGGCDVDHGKAGHLVAGTLNANGKAAGSATSQDAEAGLLIAHTLRASGFDASEDGTGRGTPLVPTVFGAQMSTPHWQHDQCDTLQAKNPKALQFGAAVRRLTPTECERLQGLPGGWTDVPYRDKPAADGPRYKAIGNGMAVPCLEWIGRRIAMAGPSASVTPMVGGFRQRVTVEPAPIQSDLFAVAAE